MKAKTLPRAAALSFVLALAACVPASPAPQRAAAPAPAPVRPVAQRPAPASGPAPAASLPVQATSAWMDAPLTPGAWRYAPQPGGGGLAVFYSASAQPLAMLQCDRAAGPAVALSLPGQRGQGVVVIRSETAARSLTLTQGRQGGGQAALSPQDPLLDAIALSKGRFAIEGEGAAPLYLPSHAEISRVIEDCR